MRASGILLPIASLPSKYGIGSLSKCAYDFIDYLKKAGQKYWQILPIGPTGYGNSPYQSFSTFAGNPYFIDPNQLIQDGLLTLAEVRRYDFGANPRYINYEKIHLNRIRMLRKAFERSNINTDDKFLSFRNDNLFWLEDYALFMALKDSFGELSWHEWSEDIKLHKKEAVEYYTKELQEDVHFYEFIQFIFMKQWTALKNYANDRGIKIIGDLPIYVAFDSADTWSHPELFQLDEDQKPIAVAGCPPDDFSATGQLWGNPLYRWDIHKQMDYAWWVRRISYSLVLHDAVRIDHFKGFDEYYSIPYGDRTAERGQWEKGPGIELFQTIEQKLGKVDIIAEDLGVITDSVRKLLKETGYPGMKVLEFAFDSGEDNDYLPHNYFKNCVVYTGTHDNDTILGWFYSTTPEKRERVLEYLNKNVEDIGDIHWDLIRLVQQSVAKLCMIPVQDYLGLTSEARINIPSTVGDNWSWRLLEGEMNEEILLKIRKITDLYGRQ